MKNTNFIQIKKIKIEKLFWIYDYEIEVKNWIAIVIWENWIWKTKILNIVYSVLNQDYMKLNDYNFNTIKIYFNRWYWKMFEIKKTDIYKSFQEFDENDNIKLPQSLKRNFYEIRDILIQEKITNYWDLMLFRDKNNYQRRFWYYSELVNELPRRYPKDVIDSLFNIIYNSIKISNDNNNNISWIVRWTKILYFPTYRRIEEDILNLWLNIEEISERTRNKKINLINFWMEDVKKLFSEKEEQIKDILAQWITTLTWNILNELSNIKSIKDTIIKEEISIDSLKIVLNRVSTLFDSKNKDKIIKICENKDINNDSHLPLKSVLLQFIKQYEKQQVEEKILKAFVSVCNNYLNNKKMFYDETNIKLSIKLLNWDEIDLSKLEEIELSNLSSWEKQIVSILSKIYLNPDERFIILFDEPELSLSITWQKTLLSDILKAWNISFLMAVTHSPYIVNDDLEQYTNFINS